MTNEELDDQVEKTGRRLQFATIAFVVTLVATAVAFGSATIAVRSNAEAAARDKADQIDREYQNCIRANDSRQTLRKGADYADAIAGQFNAVTRLWTETAALSNSDPNNPRVQKFQNAVTQLESDTTAFNAVAADYRAFANKSFQPRQCEEEKAKATG